MKEKMKRVRKLNYFSYNDALVQVGDEANNWRIYVDRQTIRLEENIDGFWKVQAVILPSKYLWRRTATYKYECRHYRNPKGHSTSNNHHCNTIGVIRDIRRAFHIELPQEMIDTMESWVLMWKMRNR